LWFDAYAGGTLYRHVVHPLFAQTIVAPKIQNVRSDTKLIDHVLTNVQPEILGYLESEIEGRFLVGNALTLADIAIASNFVVYQYIGYKIDAMRYPKLVRCLRGISARRWRTRSRSSPMWASTAVFSIERSDSRARTKKPRFIYEAGLQRAASI
jgi:glutathione S-transferase